MRFCRVRLFVGAHLFLFALLRGEDGAWHGLILNSKFSRKGNLGVVRPAFEEYANRCDKEKVIAFATMVPKMNPEVAKKALEQFPNFASTSLDVLKEYRSVIQEAMEDDRESMRSCYDMYNRVMDSLEKMLDNDDLTFEQKTYILDQMQEVAAAVADKDSEKSRNRLKLIGIIGGVAAAIVAALASSLGGNIALKESNDIDDDDITDL